MSRAPVVIVALVAMAMAALWLYSHVAPDQFGSCREVALYIGPKTTIRDCQPYGAADFAFPAGLLLIVAMVSSDEDFSWTTFLGKVERKKRVKTAVDVLRDDDLGPRLEWFSGDVEKLAGDDADRSREVQ